MDTTARFAASTLALLSGISYSPFAVANLANASQYGCFEVAIAAKNFPSAQHKLFSSNTVFSPLVTIADQTGVIHQTVIFADYTPPDKGGPTKGSRGSGTRYSV